MRSRFLGAVGLWGLLAIGQMAFLPDVLRAELPPTAYNSLRTKAEEALILTVSQVQTAQLAADKTGVTLTAKVLAKERSKAGLAIGDTITITYEIITANRPSPRRLKVLQQGQTYPAFLNRAEDGKRFQPAAYGLSFTMSPS
jgi:hypothetical protein